MIVSPAKLSVLRKIGPRGVLSYTRVIPRGDIDRAIGIQTRNAKLEMLLDMVKDGLLEAKGMTEERNPINLGLHYIYDFKITADGLKAREFASGEDGKMKVNLEFDLNTREGKMKIGDLEYFVFVDDAEVRDAMAMMRTADVTGIGMPMYAIASVNPGDGMELGLKLRASRTPPTPSTTRPIMDFGTARQVDID